MRHRILIRLVALLALAGLASVVMTSMSEEVYAARQLGARNYVIGVRDYRNFTARMA